jgi:hypothetical protein
LPITERRNGRKWSSSNGGPAEGADPFEFEFIRQTRAKPRERFFTTCAQEGLFVKR